LIFPPGEALTIVDVIVTYDREVNAAYVHLTDPQVQVPAAHMYPCDPAEVRGMINLDFDSEGRFIGIEVLAASPKLPGYVLEAAERIGAEGS